MSITRLFIIAITPGFALGFAAYLTDRYDREPLSLLLGLFILGAISTIPAYIIERILSSFNAFSGIYYAAFNAFIVAGSTEEFLKREVVLRIAFNQKYFNEKLDGIIYAAFSALGFATVENVMYVVLKYSHNPYVGLYRGILSVPGHLLFGVTMGYYLSLAKFSDNAKHHRFFLRKSFIVPMLLHGTFDFIFMSQLHFMLIIFIPFIIYLWAVNLRKLNQYYRESKLLFKGNR